MTSQSNGRTRHSLIAMAEILLILAGLLVIVIWKRLPPEVPWLYSLPWGEAQLIPKLWFVLTLPIMMMVGLVNLLIAARISKRDAVVATVVEGAVLLLTVMYLAGFFKVISIIT